MCVSTPVERSIETCEGSDWSDMRVLEAWRVVCWCGGWNVKGGMRYSFNYEAEGARAQQERGVSRPSEVMKAKRHKQGSENERTSSFS